MRGIEQRLEALEERFAGPKTRVAVIRQRTDGSWPPEPPDAALVVGVRSFAAMAREADEHLRSAIASILSESPQPEALTAEHVLAALERSGERLPLSEVLPHLTALRELAGQPEPVGGV